MATILKLKRRIQAAQNVSKTTRAMQMIAASKLRRAQEATLASRPYVEKLIDVSTRLSSTVETNLHPYLQTNEKSDKVLMIVIAPDKGLCGGLVTNLTREVLKTSPKDYSYILIGKKIQSTVAKFEGDIIAAFPFGNTLPAFQSIYSVSKLIEEQFLNGNFRRVEVLTTHFTSLFTQKPEVSQLLPLQIPTKASDTMESFSLFEPKASEMLPVLMKRYLEMSLYQYFLESYVSEQAARMMAMQNATNNAKDIIVDLKLEYNKTRQAKITGEILDITGASAAYA